MFATTTLVLEPLWPWSVSLVLLVGLALLALTALTYLVAQRQPRRFAVMVLLRLLALLVIFLLLLRPSFAQVEDTVVASRLLVLLDASESMNIGDELNGLTRWERLKRLLSAPSIERRLQQLQAEQKIDVVVYQAAEELRRFESDSKATGKRTEIGFWLHALAKLHATDAHVRGVLLFSDGAENGARLAPLEEAKRLRGLNWPIHTFGLGSPTTSPQQRDIAFDPQRILIAPNPVRIKGKYTVKAYVNAPGFENARVNVRLFLDDKQVGEVHPRVLLKTTDNEIIIDGDAPPDARDYRLTLKIEPLAGEVSKLNNEISSYLTATKDGVSVLWVEGKKRAFESVFAIRHVLARDPRFRVYFAERLPQAKPAPQQMDWFNLQKQHYDVIVIGDITAAGFTGGDKTVLPAIAEMVRKRGSGLLLLGGYQSFANSDWQLHPDFTQLLPINLDQPGQIEGPVRVVPTAIGGEYILRLADNDEENKLRWQTVLTPLDGMTRIGSVKEGATVLATRDSQEPLIVVTQIGEGRTMAFGGDTTWKAWRRTPQAIEVYERFWERTILWLAKQEKAAGSVWVDLVSRRIAAGQNTGMGITVGMKGKTGKPIDNATFTVKVIGPAGAARDTLEVEMRARDGKQHGYYWKTNEPGEYTVKVAGKGVDVDGKTLSEETEARFLAYAEDLENLHAAANHALLTNIAAVSGGSFQPAGENELDKLLQQLGEKSIAEQQPRKDLWPEWKYEPGSRSLPDQVRGLWASGGLVAFVLFCGLLCLEWYLRRRWGMV